MRRPAVGMGRPAVAPACWAAAGLPGRRLEPDVPGPLTEPPSAALAVLDACGVGRASYPGGSLRDHLVGTFHTLGRWGAVEHVAVAGLMHSVYGTFSPESVPAPIRDRTSLRAVIGPDAEELVWLYSRMDLTFLPDALAGGSPLLAAEDWQSLHASPEQILSLAWIAAANIVEPWVRLGPPPRGAQLFLGELALAAAGPVPWAARERGPGAPG